MNMDLKKEEVYGIVIDNGSGVIKAGYSGDDVPRVVMPAILGRPKHQGCMLSMGQKDTFIGDEARIKRGILELEYPIEHGIVSNWDSMEKIWHHMLFNEMSVEPEEHPLLLTDAPLNPKANRTKMTEIMFESFRVPGFYVADQSVLPLYASGRTTGIVLDSGDGVTHVAPVYEGFTLVRAVERINIGGRDVTSYMSRLLRERGKDFSAPCDLEVVKNMKEKLGFVALDYDKELGQAGKNEDLNQPYELPDGTTVSIGSERFRGPELLFKPSLQDYECPGLHKVVYKSIQSCEIDVRRQLYENLVISGGSTMFPGFAERLTEEMKKLIPPNCDIKVVSPPERLYTTWIGGSILSALSTFQEMWVTRKEYDEYGPDIVHKKCQTSYS